MPLRVRRPKRPRIVVLVDVSYSVARSAGLFLSLALRFLKAGPRTQVTLFVDRPVDATGEISRWIRDGQIRPGAEETAGAARRRRPFRRPGVHGTPARSGERGIVPGSGVVPLTGGRSFVSLLSRLPELNLSAPSDYGRVFYSLDQKARLGGRDVVLVVLGDGRVNRFDPLGWAFRDLSDRCGRVIWLVPEPRRRWGTGDSALSEYLPHCDLAVEAGDLSGLASGVREILRSL
jgi:uncharacterized protein with von Willebrand factor type A (vWA) domain